MRAHDSPLTLFSMTWRNLYRQPVRTLLTALGVSTGVIAIVAFGSIARGLTRSIETGIHHGNSELVIYQAGTAMDFLSTLEEKATREALLADPDVVETAAGQSHFLNLDDKIGAIAIIIGVHPSAYTLRDQEAIEGRLLQAADEIAIGHNLARKIKKGVGDHLMLHGRRFTIVGITRTGNVFFDGAVVMNLATLQTIMGREGKVTCFYARLRPEADPYAVAERIEAEHPHLAAIAGAEQYNKIDQGLEYADATVWTVSFLAVIIGTLVVANTMWMSVHQRTREIGVLRAVGWSRRGIIGIIVAEAAGISLLACLLGCLLGVGLAELTAMLPIAAQFLDPVFAVQPFMIALVVAVLIGILGAALPAFRAANISPVEALRYE